MGFLDLVCLGLGAGSLVRLPWPAHLRPLDSNNSNNERNQPYPKQDEQESELVDLFSKTPAPADPMLVFNMSVFNFEPGWNRVFNRVPGPREPLVVKMNTTRSLTLPPYAQLQRGMHDALRAQHPEWILPNGDCPTCDSYDARFVELLLQTLPTEPRGLKQSNSQFQFEFQHPTRVTKTHHIQ